MYIQNMDKLLFRILILEVSIIDAIKKADMLRYDMYAYEYYLLAEECKKLKLNWN